MNPGSAGFPSGPEREKLNRGGREMVEIKEVYRCEICGNMVEVVRGGKGTLVCCGKPMKLEVENTTDAAREKHVPLVEKVKGGFKVSVGSTLHPMEEKHFIEWIELVVGDRAYREFLKPGAEPEAVFMVEAESVTVREYCNLHGLWRA